MATDIRLKYEIFDYSTYDLTEVTEAGESRYYTGSTVDSAIQNYAISIIGNGSSQLDALPFKELILMEISSNKSLNDFRITNNRLRIFNNSASTLTINVGTTGSPVYINIYPYESIELLYNGYNWVQLNEISGYRILRMMHITTGATGGGAATTGSWQNTNLNTEITNTIYGASFNSGTGEFTLPAGTYFITGYQCFFRTGRSQIKLYNTSDTVTVANCVGASSFSNTSASYTDAKSIIEGRFTITAVKNFKIQYQVGSNVGANDLGVESNFAENNIFENILIKQETRGIV